MSTIIESIEQRQLKQVPRFAAGDRVRVHFQVIEGTRRRTQVFEGIVIARQGSGARETFTVRKQSFGVGVERTFPVHSPKIERLEVVARGDVRRAKLYYLRGRVGKRARVAERRWGIEDDLVLAQSAEPDAIDSEGVAPGGGRGRGRRPRSRGRGQPEAEASAAVRGSGRAGETRPRSARRGRGAGRAAKPRTGLRGTQLIPKPTTGRGAVLELVVDRRARDRARARDPGLRRQAVPDPLGVDGADARRRPAGARQPASPTTSARSRDRRHRRLPSAARERPESDECGAPTPLRASRVPAPTPRSRTRTSSSGSSPARATADDQGRASRRQRRAGRGRLGHQPLSRRRRAAATCPSRSRFRPTTTS